MGDRKEREREEKGGGGSEEENRESKETGVGKKWTLGLFLVSLQNQSIITGHNYTIL